MATKKTLDEVLKAIKGSGGVKYVVAQRLGVSRPTLDRYLDKWKTAAEALRDEDDSTADMAESVIRRNIELALARQIEKKEYADTSDAWRWLRTRRRDKFSERQEISGPDGENLHIVLRWAEDEDADANS